MAGETLPRDPDGYEGVPLSLGSADPGPATDRPRNAEVARALARAIAEADDVLWQDVLGCLDGYTRPPARAGMAAAEAAAALIRRLLEAQGRL